MPRKSDRKLTDPVQVKIQLSLTILPEQWDSEYDTGMLAQDVRRDVKAMVTNLVYDHLKDIGQEQLTE